MLRRAFLAAGPLCFLASVAHASAPAKAEKPTTQFVDLAAVALPIIVDGRLVNYVFASIRITLSPGANAQKLREKEPFFRDALIRAAHRTPFLSDRDYISVDEAKLKAALLREARAIAGPKDIVGVAVTKQAPKRRTGVPRPRAATVT
jgi:flagellar basal body-associated protein FliL